MHIKLVSEGRKHTRAPERRKAVQVQQIKQVTGDPRGSRSMTVPGATLLIQKPQTAKQIASEASLTPASRPANCQTQTWVGSEACYTWSEIFSQLGTSVIDWGKS